MERNFVTLHASVHPVHDVIMTGMQSLRFRQKSGTSQCRFFWRKRRDSNPRGLSPKRFSRPPRYDHFATLPCIKLFFNSRRSLDRLRFDPRRAKRVSLFRRCAPYKTAAQDLFATLPYIKLFFNSRRSLNRLRFDPCRARPVRYASVLSLLYDYITATAPLQGNIKRTSKPLQKFPIIA